MASLFSLVFNCNFFFLPFYFFLLFSTASSSPDNIFILAGQSNMAGRGGVTCDRPMIHCKWDGYIPPQSQPQISILRFSAELRWELAHEPLHWDIDRSKTNGVGPGMAFANQLRAEANDTIGTIGLVPCAIGGTHLREWTKETNKYYTKLVERIHASVKFGGRIRAFIWFQGESDAAVKQDAESYEKDLTKFITDLREDLFQLELPIILVKIATYYLNDPPPISYLEVVRRAEEAVMNKLPKIGAVDAKIAIQRAISEHKPGVNTDIGHLSVFSEVEVGKLLAKAYFQSFS